MKSKIAYTLLAGTFLSTSAVAQTVPTINTDYLNSLTGDKVTWENASASDEGAIEVAGKYYKATYHNIDNYEEIKDNFEQISVVASKDDRLFYKYVGTAINNPTGNDYGNINNKTFINNKITANLESNTSNSPYLYVYGGAIYNNGMIGNVTADFVENSIETTLSGSDIRYARAFSYGGAIYNDKKGVIDNIIGDFVNNSAAHGSAIYNYGEIGNINGDFIGNYAESEGAIVNCGKIGNVIGNFIGNYIDRANQMSAAINNYEEIGDITGNFIGNHSTFLGGAIYNAWIMGNVTGNFINNYAKDSWAWGGAITNDWAEKIGNITGNFIGNYVEGSERILGGAIYTVGNYSDANEVGAISGNFINNYVKVTEEGGAGLGGAIYVDGGEYLDFVADGVTNTFSGNYIEYADGSKINNAIWVDNYDGNGAFTLNFKVTNSGGYVFDDEIDGGAYNFRAGTIERDGYAYNINLSGDAYNTDKMDETNTIRFNDLVNNVYDFSIDSVQMALGKNAVINIVHNYVAQNNPYLRLDLDAVNREVGQINIEGDVDGTTNVIVNVLQNKETAKEESIVFATAKNDTLGGEDSFTVSRVIGSPYMWEVSYNDTEKQWGLYSTEEQNPDYEDDNPDTPSQPLGPIKVAPEVIATVAVKTAGLSQTNGMVYNIMRKVGVNRLYCPGCGFYDYNWDGEAFHNVWVDTTYNGLTIEAPVEIDAKVWGIEAGADIQKDLNNKLGIFVSYRQGNYEMDGKGEKYYSKVGSELDIDSYLAGLYYRYDYNNWYAFATLYGGMQNAEIQTDDGVSVDTDGIEFGGSAEVGYSHALNKTVYITPSLGIFYSQINYDDASDNYGKTVEYGNLKQVELEAGLKLSKAVYTDNGTASIYVKPSVVQTLVDGDEINITEIGKVDTIEDKTLGRIEIGGSYGFNETWSAYGWANYTFGSSYDATSLGAGVNYSW